MIVENFDKNNLPYYIAMIYGIKYKDDRRHEDEITLNDKLDPLYVRQSFGSDKNNVLKEINIDDDLRLMIMPKYCRDGEEQRYICYVVGASGEGKSYFMNMYCDLYGAYHPQNKIFYFTKNNAYKDKSLNHKNFTIVNMDNFIELYKDDAAFEQFIVDGREWNNSLLVFDDIGAMEKDKEADKIDRKSTRLNSSH